MRIKPIRQTSHKDFCYNKRVLRVYVFSWFLYPLIKPINTKQNIQLLCVYLNYYQNVCDQITMIICYLFSFHLHKLCFYTLFQKMWCFFSIEDILVTNNLLIKSWLISVITKFIAKSYSAINILKPLIHRWLCGSVAKWVENEAINTISLWWREFISLEEQIFCKDYGKMKVSTL